MKVDSIPVRVTREVYDKMKVYSNITGIPATRVLTEALEDWLETVGESRLEALAKVPVSLGSNVISISAAAN